MKAEIVRVDDIAQTFEYYVVGKINEKWFKYRVVAKKLLENNLFISEMRHFIASDRLTTSEKKKVNKMIEEKILNHENRKTNKREN